MNIDGSMFVASIRDYDALLAGKPPYSPHYILFLVNDLYGFVNWKRMEKRQQAV